MYAHCLFCSAGLGRNEALEAFPVGRRLAYDAEKGRLWVVCGACGRWNLTPLQERWEAIEQAERMFRGTRLRASTDNIGLARLGGGAELVRVGRPVGAELAVWRYGTRLVRRRRVTVAKTVATTVGHAVIDGGLFGPIAAVGALIVRLTQVGDDPYWTGLDETLPIPARVPVAVGGRLRRFTVDLTAVRVQLSAEGRPSIKLALEGEPRTFEAGEARRVLRPMLVRLNQGGAAPGQVDRAVHRLTSAGSASAYLAGLSGRRSLGSHPARSGADFSLLRLSWFDRLAFEMAVHEEEERRAMDGELAALEQAWRDAEEIAAIADGLALPRGVEAAWERLRSSVRR